MTFTTTRLNWGKTHRLINSSYPPIDLFEDIADPHDWDLLCAAEAKTNPRINESVGNLDLVTPERRVSGTGASYVMAPFTHISLDWQGRFHNGSYGAYYAGNSFETALFEVIHHRQAFFASTNEAAGWITDQRELVGKIDQELVDILSGSDDSIYADDSMYVDDSKYADGSKENHDELLDKNDYSASQAFALNVKNSGHNGIVYPSVRHNGGECFVVFYPDVISIPKQGKHISLHWNGKRINQIRIYQSPHNIVYEIET